MIPILPYIKMKIFIAHLSKWLYGDSNTHGSSPFSLPNQKVFFFTALKAWVCTLFFLVQNLLGHPKLHHLLAFGLHSGKLTYCWWTKSCTTWDVRFPVNNGINYQPQLVSRFSSISSWICPFLSGNYHQTWWNIPLLSVATLRSHD